MLETTRIDRWLCAVRIFPSRTAATEACEAGHVKVNAKSAKPSTPVRVGDTVVARVGRRERVVEVVRVIDKRVGAPVAAECLIDNSPPVERDDDQPVFVRDAGTGRPTKRDRRYLDRLRR